jgi:inositol transporter-like SP family MFS transporter
VAVTPPGRPPPQQAAAFIFMPFVDRVNRRGMLAVSIIGQTVAIGLFVVFQISYPAAIGYVLLGGICSGFGVQSFYQIWSTELFPTFAPRSTQGRSLEEIQAGDAARSATAPISAT